MISGSSPRMWGLRLLPPAMLHLPTVHPHVCGVYMTRRKISTVSNGSSPRMWGLQICTNGKGTHYRFIPTYVGFTARGELSASGQSVHPHVCGVYGHNLYPCGGTGRFIPTYVGFTAYSRTAGQFLAGSSPRMWGLPSVPCRRPGSPRFIPTYVGFTLKRVKKNVEIPSDFLPIS